MYKNVRTSQYKRDFHLAIRQGKDIQRLEKVIDALTEGMPLAAEYNDHPLKGIYKGFREYHIAPDWLLIYKIDGGVLVLLLPRTGTHQNLFDE